MTLVVDNNEKKKSIATCPKCKSENITIREVWINYIDFIQTNGIIDMAGNLEADSPNKLLGICDKCLHNWTFRGKKQITELTQV